MTNDLTPEEWDELDRRMLRVSGDHTCSVCGKVGWDHPRYYGFLIDDGTGRMVPLLHEGCDGYLWKF